jgi:nitroreductase
MDDILNTIYSRKSVREYINKNIDSEKINSLLMAAMAAPSAMNKQSWEFIVVKDKITLEQLGNIKNGAHMVKDAAMAIVVCGNLEETINDYWVQDCSAASMNILLAAHSMELGAVWTEVYNSKMELVNKVKKILNLPEYIIPLNTIAIGYPKKMNKENNVKYAKDKIHYEKW